jgi:cytochrome c oxidase assembly protein subunit 15
MVRHSPGMKSSAASVLVKGLSPARAGAEAGGGRALAYWLLACCAMIFAMVLLGGVTRLTLSGLSITEWRPLTGAVPPLSHAAWLAEFDRYRHIPQYKLINAGMSLADFQYIYWWEYVHRLWGRLIGLAYGIPFVWFVLRGQVPRPLLAPLAGILLLGFAQGGLGWYMVESGLANRVEVSQYRLVAHLALALTIYALTLWIALDVLAGSRRPEAAGPVAGASADR